MPSPSDPNQLVRHRPTPRRPLGHLVFHHRAPRAAACSLTYVLLATPPALYFTFASPDVPATMDYHRRIFGQVPWWKRRWLVFRHFFSFGRAIIDRIAILARRHQTFFLHLRRRTSPARRRRRRARGACSSPRTSAIGKPPASCSPASMSRSTSPALTRKIPAIRALLNQFGESELSNSCRSPAPPPTPSRWSPRCAAAKWSHDGRPRLRQPGADVPFLDGEARLPRRRACHGGDCRRRHW